MCGRYNILPDAKAWIDGWRIARDILDEIGWEARYNITPGSWIPIIRATSGGDGLVIDKARWGFVPHWVKDEKPKAQPANARSDGVASKPYFRDSFKHRRCLIIASGFYEWRNLDGRKQPFNITSIDGSPLLMAGIWDNWKGDDTTAIITTEANSLMVPIHDRMPVIVSKDQAQEWISGESPEQFLKPYPSELMRAYPVSTAVISPRNDNPGLLEPIAES